MGAGAGVFVAAELGDVAGPGEERAAGAGGGAVGGRRQGALRPLQHRVPREGPPMGGIQGQAHAGPALLALASPAAL